MTAFTGPQVPPPDSYEGALKAAQRDYARLMHLHDISWRVDVECKSLYLYCSCDDRPRSTTAMRDHILQAVRAARGPNPIKK